MSRSPLFALLALPACIDVGLVQSDKDDDTAALDDCADAEVPYDGVDNDCNERTPDDDLDEDGRVLADDCDDQAARVGGDEVAYDGVDNDCDAATPDDDLDGDGALHADDCDDQDAARYPGAAELCNGVDDDCDEVIDGTGAGDATGWMPDADGDGYGNPDGLVHACDPPEGYVADGGDCDDAVDTINPAGVEVCNGDDDNCDGTTDEDACTFGYGGHRIDKDGDYYYALYNDRGFGILGASDWFGSSDGASSPEGVTWNDDQTLL